eukprot:81908-Pelagomonas_calceolata.AAC.1
MRVKRPRLQACALLFGVQHIDGAEVKPQAGRHSPTLQHRAAPCANAGSLTASIKIHLTRERWQLPSHEIPPGLSKCIHVLPITANVCSRWQGLLHAHLAYECVLLVSLAALRQQQVQQIKHLSVWSDSVQSAAKAEAEGS